jgi:UDP-N-acetylenolpyruvoylglucosamine reductase
MFNFIEKNKDITELSNFKTKAKAKYYYEIHNLEQLDELKLLFKYINDNNIEHLIIG